MPFNHLGRNYIKKKKISRSGFTLFHMVRYHLHVAVSQPTVPIVVHMDFLGFAASLAFFTAVISYFLSGYHRAGVVNDIYGTHVGSRGLFSDSYSNDVLVYQKANVNEYMDESA
jgi:hypothetical protein